MRGVLLLGGERMDHDIKTRDVQKDIRTLDKKSNLSTHVKDATVKGKDAAQQEQPGNVEQSSPENYAQEKTTDFGRRSAEGVAHQTKKGMKDTVEHVKDARKVSKSANSAGGAQQAKKQTVSSAKASRQTRTAAQSATTRQTHQAQQSAKKSAQTVKTGAKGTVKQAQKTVKTAQQSAKVAVKTSQQGMKAAQGAARASKATVQAARAGTKAAVATAKAAAKAVVAMVKAIIAALQSLVSAIAAGGWVVVAVILVICMVGLLLSSVFGIFFSGEQSVEGAPTMRTAITQLNEEYDQRVAQIRSENTYDELVISGSRTPWKEVTAVYAVKTRTAEVDPQEVVTLDDSKVEILRSVFWDMNEITSRTESKEGTSVTVTDDGNGNLVETTETVTLTYLYITASPKPADEMATKYNFNAQQKAQLLELLDTQYDSMWSAVLHGIHRGSGDIVEVAASQIGNVGGQPYWSWYGFGSRVEWCATFVSWCANECGYIDAGIIPKFAGCEWQGEAWFKARNQWQERGYAPQPGDIIFFDWDHDDVSDHVGVVVSCDGSTIHTIEGNSSDAVRRSSYSVNSTSLAGFGTPSYR
jgi:cell wall-associated NlpC family hydrolase